MLNDRIGGTSVDVLKSEDACRIVPSPPKVVVRSIFWTKEEFKGSE